MSQNLNQIEELNAASEQMDIVESLQFLSKKFFGKIAFSTSFGYEDQCVTDLIFSNQIPIAVFTLDTGRMFNETYKVFSRTCEKYKKPIVVYFPNNKDIETMVSEKGPVSFYDSIENRKECCFLRKVKPLQRALKNIDCWITGLRAEQSAARHALQKFEWDNNFKLIKYNPLHDWTLEQTKNYIKKHYVPYNILHDKGFVSIGCAPCTRAIAEGEDFRAGRWWWESNSKKECGLHAK